MCIDKPCYQFCPPVVTYINKSYLPEYNINIIVAIIIVKNWEPGEWVLEVQPPELLL